MDKKPKILCLLGLSGSGKTTIETALCKNHYFKKIVSCCTRPPRDGEIDGVDYHFISDKKFEIEYNLNEYAEIGGKYNSKYAVRNSEIQNDKINVLVTAKDGLEQLLYSGKYDIISIWIDCDIEERYRRILTRNNHRYSLERIELDGFRRNEEVKTCQRLIDTTSMDTCEMVWKTMVILAENKWLLFGGGDEEI